MPPIIPNPNVILVIFVIQELAHITRMAIFDISIAPKFSLVNQILVLVVLRSTCQQQLENIFLRRLLK